MVMLTSSAVSHIIQFAFFCYCRAGCGSITLQSWLIEHVFILMSCSWVLRCSRWQPRSAAGLDVAFVLPQPMRQPHFGNADGRCHEHKIHDGIHTFPQYILRIPATPRHSQAFLSETRQRRLTSLQKLTIFSLATLNHVNLQSSSSNPWRHGQFLD